MSGRPPTAPSLVSDRFATILARFETHAAEISKLVAEAEDAAGSDLAARRDRSDAELSAIREIRDEIEAVTKAVASHPAVQAIDGLAEEDDPPPTVLSDASIENLRRAVKLRRERVVAVLPGLRIAEPAPVLVRDDAAAPPERGQTGPDSSEIAPAPSSSEATHHAVQGSSDADRAPEAEPSPASFEDPATEEGARWRGGAFPLLFAAIAIGLLVAPNVSPRLLDRMPYLCSAPLVRGLVPCDLRRATVGSEGAGTTTRPRSDAAVDSSDVAASLTAIARAGGGTLSLAPGVHEVRGPVVLSGNVTIRGASRDDSTLRLGGRGGGIVYSGGGVLRMSGVGLVLTSNGSGDVLSVSGGAIHLDDVRFAGGTSGDGVAGAGLLLGGSTTGSVSDCLVRDNGTGIWVSGRATPTISGCTIASNLARGVGYFGATGGELVASTIEGNGYMRARNDFWQGIALEDSAAPSIRDNVIRDNAGIGVQYRDSSRGGFAGNTVVGNGWNIGRYGPSNASVGGLAIGTRGTAQRPNPSIGAGNTYDNNYGGGFTDYR